MLSLAQVAQAIHSLDQGPVGLRQFVALASEQTPGNDSLLRCRIPDRIETAYHHPTGAPNRQDAVLVELPPDATTLRLAATAPAGIDAAWD